jgi:NADH:ubiquinone oxidoreductase subunit
MNFINNFFIKISCQKIGDDEFGNQYFQHKKNQKRFIIYNGIAEASKIPSQWHGWMHYNSDIVPNQVNAHKFAWQKIHLPNLTGTKNAYSPKNSTTKKTNSTYEAWQPKI